MAKHNAGWEPIADWYHGWVGKEGSDFHRHVAIPALLDLLDVQAGEQILDVGAGQGVLAPHIHQAGAHYLGIDISPKLIKMARRQHSKSGQFLVGDARKMDRLIEPAVMDGAVFLLSIQDMNPLDTVLQATVQTLRGGGRLVILMLHPCFRIPRQSGWGYDEGRQLRFRRIDRYLTALPVPMKQHQQGVTISFHRPLETYVQALTTCGLMIDRLREIPTHQTGQSKVEKRANEEIPLFLGLRAKKI